MCRFRGRAALWCSSATAMIMSRRVPTVGEMIPRALVGLAPNTRELYRSYLRLLADRHGTRKIDQIVASDIAELGVWAQAISVRRRTSVNGASAREHAISACRRLFDIAVADGHLSHNPAKAVRKPCRPQGRRTALTDQQIADIYAAPQTTRPPCSPCCSRRRAAGKACST